MKLRHSWNPNSSLKIRESIDRLGGVVLGSLEGSVRLFLSLRNIVKISTSFARGSKAPQYFRTPGSIFAHPPAPSLNTTQCKSFLLKLSQERGHPEIRATVKFLLPPKTRS